MRDHLVLTINGRRHIVRGRDALLSLSDFLRRRLGLIGTKIVCSEGDCGACTVLVGRADNPPPLKGGARGGITNSNGASTASSLSTLTNPSPNRSPQGRAITYRPVDSCIQFVFQLDGAHVITVEGLRTDGELNAVQQAMIDCHGSQCGFCTPGFVVAMTGLLEDEDTLDEPSLRNGLTGNLCRCTGYTPIVEAGIRASEVKQSRLGHIYPDGPLLAEMAELEATPVELECEHFGTRHIVASPITLDGALEFLAAHPTATIVAGATDVGVRVNKSNKLPPVTLDLNRVTELDFVAVGNGELLAGARANWTALLAACGLAAPEFARILSVFGAPQIRHVGTIGGNIANASPIADSLPFLYVMDATLILASSASRREVNINDFYRGYKQIDLNPGELIAEVRIPLPEPDDLLRLYKVTRRRDLDISGFTAAIRLRLSGSGPPPSKGGARGGINYPTDETTITHAAIALGAVGPTVMRAREAEAFMTGNSLTEETMRTAGEIASEEITPIDDVRGAAAYRRQLTRNVFLKFYHQTQADLAPA